MVDEAVGRDIDVLAVLESLDVLDEEGGLEGGRVVEVELLALLEGAIAQVSVVVVMAEHGDVVLAELLEDGVGEGGLSTA